MIVLAMTMSHYHDVLLEDISQGMPTNIEKELDDLLKEAEPAAIKLASYCDWRSTEGSELSNVYMFKPSRMPSENYDVYTFVNYFS